jgi:hypothetical protein
MLVNSVSDDYYVIDNIITYGKSDNLLVQKGKEVAILG